MIYVFLAEGFEENEAITTADIMIRGGLDVKLVSVTGEKTVKGTHGIDIVADELFEEADFDAADALVLPGGMPGTSNLMVHEGLIKLLKESNEKGKKIAAICAAPMVLGKNGILKGRKAVCYPGCEEALEGAEIASATVITDGNITTSKGPATATDFGLELVSIFVGKEKADEVAADFLYR